MLRTLTMIACAGLALSFSIGCDRSDAQSFGFGGLIAPRAESSGEPKKIDTSKEAQDEKVDQKAIVRTTYNRLNLKERGVLDMKGTDRAGNGGYTKTKTKGVYICKKCNAALYTSESKFESHCGWPSFDSQIQDAVVWQTETDGSGRIEIVCANCDGHLGHVFENEGFTDTNTRHCVNSTSMKLIRAGKSLPPRIVLAGSKEAKAIIAKEAESKKKATDSDSVSAGDAKEEDDPAVQ